MLSRNTWSVVGSDHPAWGFDVLIRASSACWLLRISIGRVRTAKIQIKEKVNKPSERANPARVLIAIRKAQLY